jgi:hypothetical protein
LEDWNCCWSRNIGIVVLSVWTMDKRDRPPCELIASTRGWFVVEKKRTTSLSLGETSFVRSQLVSPLKDKFMFSILFY